MFSVIIPSCNRLEEVQKCLACVLAQKNIMFEIIIACNGSKEYYQSLCDTINNRFPNQQIITLELPPFIGVSAARNAGAGAAQYDYLAFIDDDDLWQDDYLYNVQQAINVGHKSDVYVSAIESRDHNDNIVGTKMLTPQTACLNILYYKNAGFGGSNIIIQKSSFLDIGGYNIALKSGEDKALLIEGLKENWHISYVKNNSVIAYITDHHSLSRSKWHRIKNNFTFMKIYGDEMGIKNLIKNLIKIALICIGIFK